MLLGAPGGRCAHSQRYAPFADRLHFTALIPRGTAFTCLKQDDRIGLWYNRRTRKIRCAKKLKIYTGEEVRELRRKLGLNQSEFWTLFQITQSGGSRYESGREIPDPVQVLLNIAFATDTKAAAIFDELRQFGRQNKKAKVSAGEAK